MDHWRQGLNNGQVIQIWCWRQWYAGWSLGRMLEVWHLSGDFTETQKARPITEYTGFELRDWFGRIICERYHRMFPDKRKAIDEQLSLDF